MINILGLTMCRVDMSMKYGMGHQLQWGGYVIQIPTFTDTRRLLGIQYPRNFCLTLS